MTIQLRQLGKACAALCMLLGTPLTAVADVQQELLLFPSLQGFDSQDESDPAIRDSALHVGTTILYSISSDHFRFLGEYLLSTHESELERLKAGWRVADDAMLWFGRFHVPSRYWMNEFHHGQYLQTSITRPSLEEWEDESGSTPSHITGLLFELEQVRQDDSAIEYALSAGLAPKFANQKLEPFDLLDPRSGHGLSLTGRLGFRPKYFDSVAFGVVGSWDEINVDTPAIPLPSDLQGIDQVTAGVFANYQRDKLRLIASVVYFNNELRYFGSTTRDEFTLAYLQPEYEFTNEVTVFGRVDAGVDEDNSIFLRMLPAFVSHRNMIGIRWDFADFQALTFEAADTSRQGASEGHLHRKELRLQWSGVFP